MVYTDTSWSVIIIDKAVAIHYDLWLKYDNTSIAYCNVKDLCPVWKQDWMRRIENLWKTNTHIHSYIQTHSYKQNNDIGCLLYKIIQLGFSFGRCLFFCLFLFVLFLFPFCFFFLFFLVCVFFCYHSCMDMY